MVKGIILRVMAICMRKDGIMETENLEIRLSKFFFVIILSLCEFIIAEALFFYDYIKIGKFVDVGV